MSGMGDQQARILSSMGSPLFSGDPQRNPKPIAQPDSLGAETRRSEVEKTRETFVKVNRVAGWEKVVGVGELAIPITWPVWFIERPTFGEGYELDAASPPETGNFPQYSITVLSWEKEIVDAIREYWVGATLGVVIQGNPEQIGWVHWQMEGKALHQAGAGEGGGLDDVI